MTVELLVNQEDAGPESRVVVTYERRGNRCCLPCRLVGYEPTGDLLVEVEHLDPGGFVFRRDTRRVLAEELVQVEYV